MILKSKSRKTNSFRQLVQYVGRDCAAGSGIFAHNFYGEDPEAVIAQFEQNNEYIKGARGSVTMYHEILSLPENPKVPLRRQEAILRKLMTYYVSLRCPNNLAYGRIHQDRAHLHAHLVISANPVAKDQRLSLRRSDFDAIKKKVENYRIKHFPELGLERYMDDKAKEKKRQRLKDQPKTTDREYAFSKRTGEPSRKDRDHQTLHGIFADQSITSEIALNQQLQAAGFALYQRGELEGVQCLDRPTRYRLRTLGVEIDMRRAKDRIRVYAERRSEITRDQPTSPTRDHNRGRS